MKIIKNIIALLLTLLITFALYTLFILSNISSFFSTENIEKATSNINIIHEIEKIQNSTATAGKKAEIADTINMAYEEAESHGISKKLVDEIFNSSEVKSFLGKAVGNTTDYVVNGKQSKEITSEDFNKILDNNIDKWIKNTNTEISDSKKEVLVIRIKNASRGIIDNLPNTNTVDDTIDKNTLKNVQFIFSSQVKVALVILIIVGMSIIILLKRKQNKWILYAGIIPLITGLLTIATSFVINDLVSLSLTNYNLSFLTNSFSSVFSHQILMTGIISTIVSIVLLITYSVINKKQLVS